MQSIKIKLELQWRKEKEKKTREEKSTTEFFLFLSYNKYFKQSTLVSISDNIY